MFKRLNVFVSGLVAASALVLPQMASALIDYDDAVTGATTEINAAITAALPVGALVLAGLVGWNLFKRFVR